MSSFNSISAEKLVAPHRHARMPRPSSMSGPTRTLRLTRALFPGSIRRPFDDVRIGLRVLPAARRSWSARKGSKLSHGAAAWLRHAGIAGGHAWKAARWPGRKPVCRMVPAASCPPRDQQGRTVWVTRARPKIDRIACPWLIRRFVDPDAVFLFVAPAGGPGVAERFAATPSTSKARCLLEPSRRALHLRCDGRGVRPCDRPLLRLATIVRGADTARLDLAPEAAGLLAASLGLSRMYADDLEQLEAGMALYDAFYRWCRDATEETHNWPAHKPQGREHGRTR